MLSGTATTSFSHSSSPTPGPASHPNVYKLHFNTLGIVAMTICCVLLIAYPAYRLYRRIRRERMTPRNDMQKTREMQPRQNEGIGGSSIVRVIEFRMVHLHTP